MRELDGGLQQLSDSFDQLRRVSTDMREGKLDQDLDADLPVRTARSWRTSTRASTPSTRASPACRTSPRT